jgi:hypothetical protein
MRDHGAQLDGVLAHVERIHRSCSG